MRIAVLQKLTLLDYPDKVACTVFLGGCNLRCPFCHNSALVFMDDVEDISEESFFSFLEKRVGILDGVAITGGEPLLTDEVIPFIERIKEMGYAVKLDTNGCYPERLKKLVQKGMVDYVAMDIKNAPDKYTQTCGLKVLDFAKVQESVRFLKEGTVPYEFRTTVVEEFHEPMDFEQIGQWLEGAQGYYLQCFKDSGACICEGLHAPSEENLRLYRALAAKYVPNTHLRGV